MAFVTIKIHLDEARNDHTINQVIPVFHVLTKQTKGHGRDTYIYTKYSYSIWTVEVEYDLYIFISFCRFVCVRINFAKQDIILFSRFRTDCDRHLSYRPQLNVQINKIAY